MGYTRICNTTLENFFTQYGSVPYDFKANTMTKVNDLHAQGIVDTWKHRGLFIVPDEWSADSKEFKAGRRQALLTYLENTLNERIRNYQLEIDQVKRQGGTIDKHPAMLQAEKWREEIIKLLGVEAPIVENKSYMDTDLARDVGVGKDGSLPEPGKQENVFASAPLGVVKSDAAGTAAKTEPITPLF